MVQTSLTLLGGGVVGEALAKLPWSMQCIMHVLYAQRKHLFILGVSLLRYTRLLCSAWYLRGRDAHAPRRSLNSYQRKPILGWYAGLMQECYR